MSALTNPADMPTTMTSREIADLTGSTHDNVLKTVRSLVEKGLVSGNETPYTHPQNGQTYSEFCLSYRDTMVVMSGYSVKLRAKIIDRWQELEEQARNPIAALSRLDLLKLATETEEERLQLERRVAVMSPKVEALDRIADADGLMPPMNAAKALQVPPKRLFTHLRTHGWTYRRAGARSDVAYQDKIAAGLLTHKVHVARREDGSEKVCEQVMVTPKGLTKLAQELAAH